MEFIALSINKNINIMKFRVEVITFDDLMEYSSFFDLEKSIVIKIDIEGIEERVLRSIDFKKYNSIKTIILEKDEINLKKEGLQKLIQKRISLQFKNFFIAIIKIIN